MDLATLRVEMAHLGAVGAKRRRRCFGFRDPQLVDARSAQEARLLVRMLFDDLQQQCAGLLAAAQESQQQAVGVIELRAVQ